MTQLTIELRKARLDDEEAAALSDEERARLALMREENRPQFQTGRSLLRRMLGASLEVAPSDVRLSQTGAGRVRLDHPHADRLHFSVSHTATPDGAYVAAVVAKGVEVGVDIEGVSRHLRWQRVAKRRFSPGEWSYLARQTEEAGRQDFFRMWTLKESIVKLRDDKLLRVLREEVIDLEADEPRLHSPEGVRLWSGTDPKAGLGVGLAYKSEAALPVKLRAG